MPACKIASSNKRLLSFTCHFCTINFEIRMRVTEVMLEMSGSIDGSFANAADFVPGMSDEYSQPELLTSLVWSFIHGHIMSCCIPDKLRGRWPWRIADFWVENISKPTPTRRTDQNIVVNASRLSTVLRSSPISRANHLQAVSVL
jgi:hypothetical protein